MSLLPHAVSSGAFYNIFSLSGNGNPGFAGNVSSVYEKRATQQCTLEYWRAQMTSVMLFNSSVVNWHEVDLLPWRQCPGCTLGRSLFTPSVLRGPQGTTLLAKNFGNPWLKHITLLIIVQLLHIQKYNINKFYLCRLHIICKCKYWFSLRY